VISGIEPYLPEDVAYPRWRDYWKWLLAYDGTPGWDSEESIEASRAEADAAGIRRPLSARSMPSPLPRDHLEHAIIQLLQAAATRPELRAMHAPEYDDVTLALIGDAWNKVRECIRTGDPPGRDEIGFLVRLGRVPHNMFQFVADMLEGRIKQNRGRRASRLPYTFENERRAVIVHRVFRWKRAIERQRARTSRSADPYQEALMRVSVETEVPESTLDKWCYPRS